MGFALPSPSSGTSRFFGFDRVCLIPNLLSLLNDNFTTVFIVNLPSSDEFQFLSFVSQSGYSPEYSGPGWVTDGDF